MSGNWYLDFVRSGYRRNRLNDPHRLCPSAENEENYLRERARCVWKLLLFAWFNVQIVSIANPDESLFEEFSSTASSTTSGQIRTKRKLFTGSVRVQIAILFVKRIQNDRRAFQKTWTLRAIKRRRVWFLAGTFAISPLPPSYRHKTSYFYVH